MEEQHISLLKIPVDKITILERLWEIFSEWGICSILQIWTL